MLVKLAVLSAAVSSAYGHAFVNSVTGANGISGVGLGVTFNGEVERGGTTEQPFQLDTPVLKDTATDPCGATLLGGSVNIATSMAAVSKAFGGIPTIPADGTLTMGVFQVNADGGGPFAAEINTDATGKTWSVINVVSQPPGVNGVLHNGPANSSITVQVPAGTTCTGAGSTCLIRLNNGGETSSIANGAGPFGGCVAVSQASASSTGATATGATGATASTGATGTTGTTGTTGKSKNKGAAAGASAAAGAGKNRNRVVGRHFYPSLSARKEAIADVAHRSLVDMMERELSPLMEKRSIVEREIAEKRQLLTAQILDELSTVTGTAIDIPIDRLAGHDDNAAQGGNSTTPTNAVLTTQQAIDLKKAVQTAIGNAMELLASTQVDAGAGGQDSAITDKTNAAAAAAQAGGATSINAGNAGVGFFNTANVDSLLGEIVTASLGVNGAAATGVAGTAAAATITPAATATGTASTKGSGRNKNKNAGANAQANNRFQRRNAPRRL
ncbi:hypothetical protein PENSPDRAFT_687550 [Peniophora sp. CONT]|nr:hypothetical protein PENSPDRAFT_687550 [Peniophora sp. CONT]